MTKRGLLIAVVLAFTLLLLSTVFTMTSEGPLINIAEPQVTIPTSVPPLEVMSANSVTVKISLEDAIRAVEDIWSTPPLNATVVAHIIKDHIEGAIYWEISWRSGQELILVAKVDAESGVVFSIFDFKLAHASKTDNIKSCEKAIEIAKNLLTRLKVDPPCLSNPDCRLDVIRTANDQLVTYWVTWHQVYHGLRVVDGFVSIEVSAERGVPVGFHIKLINVSEVDASPIIRKDEAVRIARALAEQRGYGVGGVESVELRIIRPNYYWSGLLARLGNPTLVWLVVLRDPCGCPIEVHVDAKTGELVGGQVSRCRCGY